MLMQIESHSSLGHKSPLNSLRALWAVVRREWLIFVRYPSWIISLFIWPVIFPLSYVLTARALSGRDGAGLAQFQAAVGMQDTIGFIVIGTTIWMWQNVVLWNVGFSLRKDRKSTRLNSS